MKDYLILITSVIIFLAIFEGVLPQGKFGKTTKSIISMVVVLVILTPIVKIFNSNFDFNNILLENLKYQEYLDKYQKETLEKEISSLLTIEGYVVSSVNVTISSSENKVKILIEKDELISDMEHIDILEKAKSLVIERFYLSNWEVIVA